MALACGARDAVALAGQAERAGFDSVWATEFSWRSATVPMAAIAATTTRITIGSAIAYALGRTPAVLAAEARDIDELSGGRLILGLGSAQPDRVRRWFGADGTDLAAHVGEVVEAVRTLWGIGAAPVRYDGRHLRVSVEATPSAYSPLRARPPILLAGVNAAMVRVAGAVADGLIAHPMMDAATLEESVVPALRSAAEQAQRPSAPTVVAMLIVVINDDEERARRDAAAQIAFYAQHRTYAPLMRRYGFEQPAARIGEALSRGDWPAAVALVPDAMIDRLAAAGSGTDVRAKVDARRNAGGCDTLILHTPSMLMDRAATDPAARYRSHLQRLLDTFAITT